MFLINKKPPSFEAVNQPENKSLLAASLFVDSGYNIYHVNTSYSIYLSVSIPIQTKRRGTYASFCLFYLTLLSGQIKCLKFSVLLSFCTCQQLIFQLCLFHLIQWLTQHPMLMLQQFHIQLKNKEFSLKGWMVIAGLKLGKR